jgi:hypothetical protein
LEGEETIGTLELLAAFFRFLYYEPINSSSKLRPGQNLGSYIPYLLFNTIKPLASEKPSSS